MCATEETKGFYYSLYWGLYMMSNIFGSLIGSFLIKLGSGPSFYFSMGCIMVIAAFGQSRIQLPELDDVRASRTSAVQKHKTIMEELTGTLQMLVNPRMLYLDAYILWTGFSVSFWSSLLIPTMIIQLGGTTGDTG